MKEDGAPETPKTTNRLMARRHLFLNCGIDKKKLKGVVARLLGMDQDFAVVELLEMLKRVGFQHATEAGSSIGLDDLLTPPSKDRLMLDAELYILWGKIHQSQGLLSLPEQAYRGLLLWQKINETLKQQVIDHFYSTDILNPVYMMAFSGARGNITQVHQLVGMRGLMADPEGNLIDFPIKSNFREGLTLTEYLISCFGARKGVVDTALRTATAGYLTRRLVDVSHHIVVATPDCLTTRGLVLKALSKDDKVVSTLTGRLLGRVLAETVLLKTRPTPSDREWFLCFNADKKWQHAAKGRAREEREGKNRMDRNQPISPLAADRLAKVRDHVLVRSPLTCETVQSICRLCYGWGLAYGRLIQLGQAVGVIAGQSIGEPGTQLTMRTFHTGGVFSGQFTEKLMRAPCSGRVWLPNRLKGWLTRTGGGELAFFACRPLVLRIHPVRGKVAHIKIKPSTLLVVRNGQTVLFNQVLAEFAETPFLQTKEEKLLGVDMGGYLYTSQPPTTEAVPWNQTRMKPTSPVKLLSGRVLFRQPLPPTRALHQPQEPADTGDALDQKTSFLTSRFVGKKIGFVSLIRQLRHMCLISTNDSQSDSGWDQTRVRKQKAGGFAVGQNIPAAGQPSMREAALVGPVCKQTRRVPQVGTRVGEPTGLDRESCFREMKWYTAEISPTETLFFTRHLPDLSCTPWSFQSLLSCKKPHPRGNPCWLANNPTPPMGGGGVLQLGFATPLISLVFQRVDYHRFGYLVQTARRLKPTQAVFRTSLSESFPLCQELVNRFGLQILSAKRQAAGGGISWGDSLYFDTSFNRGSSFSLREDWHELKHRGGGATGLLAGAAGSNLQPVSPPNQPGWAQLAELTNTERWQTSVCLQTVREKASIDGQPRSGGPNGIDRQSASLFRLSAAHTPLSSKTTQLWRRRVGCSLHTAHHFGVGWEETQESGLKPPGHGFCWVRVSHPLLLNESPRWLATPTSPLPTSHNLLWIAQANSVKKRGGCLGGSQLHSCLVVCSFIDRSNHFTTLWQRGDVASPGWRRCGVVEAPVWRWLSAFEAGSSGKGRSQRVNRSKLFACFCLRQNKQTHVLATTKQKANNKTGGSCQEVGKSNELLPQQSKTVFARVCLCLLVFVYDKTSKQNREVVAGSKSPLLTVMRDGRPWSIAERQEQGGDMASVLGVRPGWICFFKRRVIMARSHVARRHVARRHGVFFRVGQQIAGGVHGHGLTGGVFGNHHLVVEWVCHNPSSLIASKAGNDKMVSASSVSASSPPFPPRLVGGLLVCNRKYKRSNNVKTDYKKANMCLIYEKTKSKHRLVSIRHRSSLWGKSLGLFQACFKRATASSPSQKEFGGLALLPILRQLFAGEEEPAFTNRKVVCNSSCRWGPTSRKRLTISRVDSCLFSKKGVSPLAISTPFARLFQLGDGPVFACKQTHSWFHNELHRSPAVALIRKMVEIPRRPSTGWKRKVSTLLQVETFCSPKQELSLSEQQPKHVSFDLSVCPPDSQLNSARFVFSIYPPISPDLGIRLAPLGRGSCLVRQGFSSKRSLLPEGELAKQTTMSYAPLTRMVNTAKRLPDINTAEWDTAFKGVMQQEGRRNHYWAAYEASEEHLRETGWAAGKGMATGNVVAGKNVSRCVQVWYIKETSLHSLFATMEVVATTPLLLTGCQSRLATATSSLHPFPSKTNLRDQGKEREPTPLVIQEIGWGGIPHFTLSSFGPLPSKLSAASSSVYSENRSQLVVKSLLAVQGELVNNTSSPLPRLLLTHAEQTGLGLESNSSTLLVSDILQRGQSTGLNPVAPKDGKIVQVEKNLAVLQHMAALPRGGKSTILINPGRIVAPGAPFMAFSTFQQKTEDIVQGIPKIEQLFEGRAEIEKAFLRSELSTCSKENLQHYPNPEAMAKSYEKIQIMVVEAIQQVYLSQSVTISDKHIEIVVKQMTLSVYMHNANQEFGYLFPIPVNLVQFSKSFHFGLGVDRPAFQQRFRDRVARQRHRNRFATVGKPPQTTSLSLHTTLPDRKEKSRRGQLFQRPTTPFALLATDVEARRSTNALRELWQSAQPSSLSFWSHRPGVGASTPKASGQTTKIVCKQTQVANRRWFANKQKVRWVCAPLLVGITQAALSSRSFLSAASFQQTVLVLGRSASAGRTDFLRGIKERGAVGESMISGTGGTTLFSLLRKQLAAARRQPPRKPTLQPSGTWVPPKRGLPKRERLRLRTELQTIISGTGSTTLFALLKELATVRLQPLDGLTRGEELWLLTELQKEAWKAAKRVTAEGRGEGANGTGKKQAAERRT